MKSTKKNDTFKFIDGLKGSGLSTIYLQGLILMISIFTIVWLLSVYLKNH